MDGYGYGYPPGSTPDYSSPPIQRPASQTNAPSPHPGECGGFGSLVCPFIGCWIRFVAWTLDMDAVAKGGRSGVLCVNGTWAPIT
jgi:hypothetical protein